MLHEMSGVEVEVNHSTSYFIQSTGLLIGTIENVSTKCLFVSADVDSSNIMWAIIKRRLKANLSSFHRSLLLAHILSF